MKSCICLLITLGLFATGALSLVSESGQLNIIDIAKRSVHTPLYLERTQRSRRESSSDGLLKVKQIKAQQIKTENLKAKRVKADRIKSDTIISETIVVKGSRPKPEPLAEIRSFEEPANTRNPAAQSERSSSKSPTYIRVDDLTRSEPVNIDIQLPFRSSSSQSRIESNQDPSPVSRRGRRRRKKVKSTQNLDELMGLSPNVEASPSASGRSETRSRRRFSQVENPLESSNFQNSNSFVDPKRSSPMELSIQPLESQPIDMESTGRSGVLRAQEIAANNIRTGSMKADSIAADHIRSRRVNAKTLRIDDGKLASMSFFVHPDQKDSNLVIDKYESTSPTESSVMMTTDVTPNNEFIRPKDPSYTGIDNTQTVSDNYPTEPLVDSNQNILSREGLKSKVYLNPSVQTVKPEPELSPSLELLGITRQNRPELNMYVEQPVIKQLIRPIVQFRYSATNNRPQTIGLVSNLGQTEYISDNYNSVQKSVNSINDGYFL